MTIEELLDLFTFAEDLPEEAQREATSRRAELVEPFLAEVERWIADTDADPDEPSPLFFLVHLIASWRERRGYALLCRMLRADPARLEAALGDAITETIPRLVVTLFDGVFAPIREVIEADEADEIARSSLVEAIGALVEIGKLPRADAVAYLAELPSRASLPAAHPAWMHWALVIADLKASELRGAVDDAFARRLIPADTLKRADFLRELERARPETNVYAEPFSEDVVAELAEAFEWEAADAPSEPVVNPYRRVGRNDPCPCGSGKKYKRCCGA